MKNSFCKLILLSFITFVSYTTQAQVNFENYQFKIEDKLKDIITDCKVDIQNGDINLKMHIDDPKNGSIDLEIVELKNNDYFTLKSGNEKQDVKYSNVTQEKIFINQPKIISQSIDRISLSDGFYTINYTFTPQSKTLDVLPKSFRSNYLFSSLMQFNFNRMPQTIEVLDAKNNLVSKVTVMSYSINEPKK